MSECEHTGLNAHNCIYKSGSCYKYEVADKVCLMVQEDGPKENMHWKVVGGCYEKGINTWYVPGLPNHNYNFDHLQIELHPVLQETSKRPINKVVPVDVSWHGFVKFCKWFFFFLFIICLVAGIVFWVLDYLAKNRGANKGEWEPLNKNNQRSDH